MSHHARLVFLGTGATPPPRGRRNAAMLLVTRGLTVLFDAPPDLRLSDLPASPSAILLTDRDPSFVRSARRLAQATGARFEMIGRLVRPVRIEPFRVTHTRSHATYAYRIEAARVAVYAPEYFRLPRAMLSGADVAILDGSTWERDITSASARKRAPQQTSSFETARSSHSSPNAFERLIGMREDYGRSGHGLLREGQGRRSARMRSSKRAIRRRRSRPSGS